MLINKPHVYYSWIGYNRLWVYGDTWWFSFIVIPKFHLNNVRIKPAYNTIASENFF